MSVGTWTDCDGDCRCSYCESVVSPTELRCDCTEGYAVCVACEQDNDLPLHCYNFPARAHGHYPPEEITEVDGRTYCYDHAACGCCGLGEDGDEGGRSVLKDNPLRGYLTCPACWEEDHYCEEQGPLLDYLSKKV